jgi:hypothetical protein
MLGDAPAAHAMGFPCTCGGGKFAAPCPIHGRIEGLAMAPVDAVLAEYGLRRVTAGEPGRVVSVAIAGAARLVWVSSAPEGPHPYDADSREHYQTADDRAVLARDVKAAEPSETALAGGRAA